MPYALRRAGNVLLVFSAHYVPKRPVTSAPPEMCRASPPSRGRPVHVNSGPKQRVGRYGIAYALNGIGLPAATAVVGNMPNRNITRNYLDATKPARISPVSVKPTDRMSLVIMPPAPVDHDGVEVRMQSRLRTQGSPPPG